MRGKLVLERHACALGRIIPARAGQTSTTPDSRGRTPDHPRACGANGGVGSSDIVQCGSSPRVRGKLPPIRERRNPLRIIPARAGQTQLKAGVECVPVDHPRACGANYEIRPMGAKEYGSSPRVRGKRAQPGNSGSLIRIIPARAGQTNSNSMWQREYADHPRACGANAALAYAASLAAGSSPRVRGKP